MGKIKPYYGAGLLLYVTKNDEVFVLLGRRSIKPEKNKWSIAGGGWDNRKDGFDKENPNYLNAAIRETREELSYKIEVKLILFGRAKFHFFILKFMPINFLTK